MQQLDTKLREIANSEASIHQEAYEMLEIVTNVIGELEDDGDNIVNEFGAYQMGRRSKQGKCFIGRLIKSVIRFISRWPSTKQQVEVIVKKQQSMKAAVQEGTDWTKR